VEAHRQYRPLDSAFSIPSHHEMMIICEQLAPVLRLNGNFELDPPSFWGQVKNVMIATMSSVLPDPVTDFLQFVLFLLTFRSLLKPETVKDCLFYMDRFFLGPLEPFFLTQLPCIVWVPELLIRLFDHLHRAWDPQWVTFISQGKTSSDCMIHS
jgi:hypothetical protein